MRQKHIRGFTLIELIAVIAILSVLLAVTIPSYFRINQKAQEAVCHANVKIIQNAYGIYTYLEDDEVIEDHPDIVAFLTEKGLLHVESIPECLLGGIYFLEDKKVFCSIHTNLDEHSFESQTSSEYSEETSDESLLSEGYEQIQYTFTTTPYSGGFSYNLIITNRSEEDISGWVAEFTYPGIITACWGGELENLGDSRYRITCHDYNYFIGSESSLSISGQGTLHSGSQIEDFVLKRTYDSINASATFRITSQTGSSFQFEVLISNHGDQKITGWILEIEYPGHIVRVWDARMLASESGRFRFQNPRYSNLTILPGQTLRFAGQGTNPSAQGPSMAFLNGTIIPIS
jgi:prepilin-type N-terminal cleavage/methylation domain-containing protein